MKRFNHKMIIQLTIEVENHFDFETNGNEEFYETDEWFDRLSENRSDQIQHLLVNLTNEATEFNVQQEIIIPVD